jgi:hypothetical protein
MPEPEPEPEQQPAAVDPLAARRSAASGTAAGPPAGAVVRSTKAEDRRIDAAAKSKRAGEVTGLVRMAVIATFAMTLQSRFIAVAQATLLRKLLHGDAAATASKLAVMTTVSSLASFVANPALGQASDVFGAPLVTLLLILR